MEKLYTRNTKESAAKISAKLTGRRLSEHTKELIRAKAIGRKHSPETVEKLRVLSSRRRHTEATKELLRKKKTGVPRPDMIGNKFGWRKGWTIANGGYIRILKNDHPSADKSGYVLEHRLVMEDGEVVVAGPAGDDVVAIVARDRVDAAAADAGLEVDEVEPHTADFLRVPRSPQTHLLDHRPLLLDLRLELAKRPGAKGGLRGNGLGVPEFTNQPRGRVQRPRCGPDQPFGGVADRASTVKGLGEAGGGALK